MSAIILIGVASVLVLFMVVAATRPSVYHVERKLEVAAPAELVFGVVNDLRQFADVFVLFGSPLEKLEPSMKKIFEGPAAGIGQSYAWSGKKVGKAKMTIEESIPGQKVGIKLEFVAPMKSTATYAFTFADTATGSFVTWSMHGNHNFIGKAFGMFMNIDNMLATDLEKGGARLKAVAESKQRARAAVDGTGASGSVNSVGTTP